MVKGRRPSREAMEKHAADAELAAQFPDLFRAAKDTEDALRRAQARHAPLPELRKLALALDAALTAAMRAAYATERAEIGPLGYDDWIFRRKAKAKPKVKMWLAEAERLLTLREEHRLSGIPPLPPQVNEAANA
jgi:hypothetical protein